jgi:hypothetical protein
VVLKTFIRQNSIQTEFDLATDVIQINEYGTNSAVHNEIEEEMKHQAEVEIGFALTSARWDNEDVSVSCQSHSMVQMDTTEVQLITPGMIEYFRIFLRQLL